MKALILVSAFASVAAVIASPNPAIAGNSYWVPCHYVTTPRGTIRSLDYSQFANGAYQYTGPTSGIAVSKGLIACTRCGETTYTYDASVLKSHGYEMKGGASAASSGKGSVGK